MEMIHYSDAVDYIADTQHGARITDSLVGFFSTTWFRVFLHLHRSIG